MFFTNNIFWGIWMLIEKNLDLNVSVIMGLETKDEILRKSTWWKTLIYDALRDLVPFVQFKKRENTHGGVLLLVKLQA